MKKILSSLLGVIFLVTLALAQEHLFEPKQSDYDNPDTRAAIHAQQARYSKAAKQFKKSGYTDEEAYKTAESEALFYFQKAWLEIHQADNLIKQGKYDEALSLLETCKKNCEAEEVCDPDGSHAKEQVKAKSHIHWAKEFIADRRGEK